MTAPGGKRNHCIISGTGRAGTSLLVQLLTHLGLDTGFSLQSLTLYQHARAGLELDVRKEDAPYIVKSPWLCDYIHEVLADERIIIDRAIIPVRDLVAAAKSRIHVEETTNNGSVYRGVPGGLWHTKSPDEQAAILAEQFHKLVQNLVQADVPITFLAYPRLVRDSRYLYTRLGSLLESIPYERFATTFESVVRPDWVHSFTPNDR